MKKLYWKLFSSLLSLSFYLSASVFFQAQAQTNDLMIVEYVDWNPGDGFAVEIYNPTGSPIALSGYYLNIYNNGSTTASSSSQLSGTLAPCASITVGNFSGCTLNLNLSVSGVNGDDAIGLTFGNTNNFVDMVGLYGGGGPALVANVSNALKWHRLTRKPTNTIRYTAFDGTSVNSWPGLATANVSGWDVTGVSCIVLGHTLAGLTFNIGNDTTICNGNSLTLDAGMAGATYLWSTGATTQQIQVTSGGTYYVQVNNGCALGSASRVITELPALQIQAGPDISVPCKANQPILLSASITGNNVSVRWSGGKGTFSNPTSLLTTYTPSLLDFNKIKLKLTGTSTCGQQSDEVLIFNGDSTKLPTGLTISPANPKAGDPVTFQIQTSGANAEVLGHFNYGDGSALEYKKNVGEHIYNAAGTYNVKIATSSITGCPFDSLTARIVIAEKPVLPLVEVIIPNIFTPNNDGFNDRYAPQLPETTSYKLQIFNRWGVLVFESTSPEKTWDGKIASDGVYYAHLHAEFASGEVLNKKLPVTVVK